MARKMALAALAWLLAFVAWSDIRLSGGHARADMESIEATTPVLTIPTGVLAAGNSTVTVPVHFANNLRGVAAIAFSLNFDSACLAVDLNKGVLAPGVVQFNLPPQFSGSAFYEAGVPGGRLDFVLGDYALPLSTLPDTQNLVTITFRTTCLPPAGTTVVAPVTFSAQPATSYSNTLGHPITGRTVDGSVNVKRWLPPGTPTPTPTPGPAPVVNSAPIARDDEASTKLPQPVIIDVLANDMDPDGDPLHIVSVTQGGLGQVATNADGTLTYTPISERSGQDRFTYVISDGRGGLASAAVWVTVAPANKPPVAVDDKATTDENTAVTIDVLANDFDPDGDSALLSIGVLGQPAHGRVHRNAAGKAVYTPDANYNGKDAFVYAVVDAEGGSDLATVQITIRPVDGPPPVSDETVDLTDFSVKAIGGKMQLEWTSRSEKDSAGYYIYRTQGPQLQTGLMSMPYIGAWKRVSPLIEGKGSSGGLYRYIDKSVQPNVLYAYMLVAIDQSDNISLFGPRSATGPAEDSGEMLFPFIIRN
jgi:hypothetical protein